METHRRTDTHTSVLHNGTQTIASTIHWPDAAALASAPPVLVCVPGAGYNRRYFDLPAAGYSQAEHHVAAGMIVITMDPLSAGESSVPPPEQARMADVAAANHAALDSILAELRSLPEPLALGPVIGVGHSLGGNICVAMQAAHRSFDAVAILGTTMVNTRLPSTTPWREIGLPAGVSASSPEGLAVLRDVDWRVISHWPDVPENLVARDMAPDAPWRSAHIPNVGNPLELAMVSREAAVIDVPLLIAHAERDICHDILREIAAFHSAHDISLFQVPSMAHIHNFASTRAMMWDRVCAFTTYIASSRQA